MDNTTAPPPYTRTQTVDAEAALDHIIDISRRMNADAIAAQSRAASASSEVDRVRSLFLFTLSVDYQCYTNVALSATDRDHFISLDNLRIDLKEATEHGEPYDPSYKKKRACCLTNAERRQLAPYFLKYVHEPCRALGVPVELMLQAIQRLRLHSDWFGRYKGCCFAVLHGEDGVAKLASKLYHDKQIVIPALLSPGPARRKMLRAVSEISDLYFEKISGVDSLAIESDGRGFDQIHDMSYVANKRGASYEKLHRQGTLVSSLTMSWYQFTTMAQRCVRDVVERRREIEDGDRDPDTPTTWQGDGHSYFKALRSSYQPMYSRLRQPQEWLKMTSFGLPDFFENRPAPGCNDF